jgi:hypothetical protein
LGSKFIKYISLDSSAKYFILFVLSVGIHKCNYLFSQIIGLNFQSIIGITLLSFPLLFLYLSYYFSKDVTPFYSNSRYVQLIFIYINILLIYGILNGNFVQRAFEEYWTGLIVLLSYKLSNSKAIWNLFEKELIWIYIGFSFLVYIGTGYVQDHLLSGEFENIQFDSITVSSVAYDISPILDFWPFILLLGMSAHKKIGFAKYLHLLPVIIYVLFQFYFLKRAPTIRAVFHFSLGTILLIYYQTTAEKKGIRALAILFVFLFLAYFFLPENLSDRFKTEDKARQNELANMFSQLSYDEWIFGRGLGGEYNSGVDGIYERINQKGVEVKSTLHLGFGDSILKGGLILFSLISLHGISLIIKNLNRIKLISKEQFAGLGFLITFLLFRFIEGGISPGSIFNAVLFGMSLGVLENNKDIRIK